MSLCFASCVPLCVACTGVYIGAFLVFLGPLCETLMAAHEASHHLKAHAVGHQVRSKAIGRHNFVQRHAISSLLQEAVSLSTPPPPPRTSYLWTCAAFANLRGRLREIGQGIYEIDYDLCTYGLTIPSLLPHAFLRKSSRIWTNLASLQCLASKCPGKSHLHQHCHALGKIDICGEKVSSVQSCRSISLSFL